MLKKFFISMLGTMAGLWLSFFILIIGMVVAVSIMVASAFSNSSTMKDSNILYISLSGDIPERQADFNLNSLLSMNQGTPDNLADILNSIKLAANDRKIKGIYIDCGGSSLGIASRSEILEALKAFKKSGKWVVAYADNFEQGDYYVSSVANDVYLNPVGMVNVHGLASQVMFYKNLLEKIGVEVQIVKVGSFKSAVEPFIRTDMSEPSRLQTSIFLNQIWGDMSTTIANNRDIDPSQVQVWADSMAMTWDPQRYIDTKAVDKLMYRSEVEKLLHDKMHLSQDKELPLVTPAQYMAENALPVLAGSKDHVAVLYAVGDITESDNGGIASARLVPEIEKLAKDDKVKGMVLRVNSPGGSAFASEQIWKALEDFKAAGKPLYVSMSDYAASGGYYISCGADKIFADASTLTGSIGIFGMIPNAKKLLNDKLGLNIETVETSPNAVFPSLYAPGTPEQMAAMQSYVERGYETFTSRVAQGRNISIDSVKAIGGGRVWDGQSALKIGLVDEIGTLQDAVDALCSKLNLESKDWTAYPALKDPMLDFLMQQLGTELPQSALGLDTQEMKECVKAIRAVKDQDPLQARMETVIIR